MKQGEHSYMAEATARMRAAHQLLDQDPKILDDDLAVKILGTGAATDILENAGKYRQPTLRRARTMLVVRARYVEDEFHKALARGIRQLVVLGAGLDTLVYRLADHPPEHWNDLRMFEVDHPDTQRWKLELLQAAGFEIPASLSHVAVDFERQSLANELSAAGFEPGSPAFVSWLGVSYYLVRPDVMKLFEYARSLARSSQLVFDFLLDEACLDEQGKQAVHTAEHVASANLEPLRTRFEPEELHDILQRIGFSTVFRLNPEQATSRYLSGRTDGLSLDASLQLMSATV